MITWYNSRDGWHGKVPYWEEHKYYVHRKAEYVEVFTIDSPTYEDAAPIDRNLIPRFTRTQDAKRWCEAVEATGAY